MGMYSVFEKEATILRNGGSLYALLESNIAETLGVTKPPEGKPVEHDVMVALVMTDVGPGVLYYSKGVQKKWKSEHCFVCKKLKGECTCKQP
jgi:hypothetical protein